jgi:beta-mannosidase
LPFSALPWRRSKRSSSLDLRLENEAQTVLAENRYAFTRDKNLRPLLETPAAALAVRHEPVEDGWAVTITNPGQSSAMGVWLEDGRDLGNPGYVYFDSNYFCLLPGETRLVGAKWDGVGVDERVLSVMGWNTEEHVVR